MRCVKVLSCAALTAALALAVGCKLLPDNEWPEPYTSIAKEEVQAPIDIQVANARVVEQTLWDYHFEPNSERLNSTGRQRLRWIAPQAQDTYPVIYVAAIDDAELTQRRVARVQVVLDEIAGPDSGVQVVQADARMVGLPGRHVETVFKKMAQTGFANVSGGSQPALPQPPSP